MKPPSASRTDKVVHAARATTLCLSMAIALTCSPPAHARSPSSELSDLSTLSVAVSVALPVMLVAGVGSVVVKSVEVSADGIVWVVENTVDGAKASVRVAGHAVGASAVAVGTVITVTALATGTLLCAAGQAIAFIPNEIGKSMLYNEQVSR